MRSWQPLCTVGQHRFTAPATNLSVGRDFDELSRVAQSSRSVESLSRVAQSSRLPSLKPTTAQARIRSIVINFIFGLTSIQPNALVRIRYGVAIRRKEQRESNEPGGPAKTKHRLVHGKDPAAY
jgi:hypothetical protein